MKFTCLEPCKRITCILLTFLRERKLQKLLVYVQNAVAAIFTGSFSNDDDTIKT